MPRNKDLKRQVRARMAKTGESYTAARAQLLGRPSPALPPDHEALAGQRDASVREKTGRDWAGWAALLDDAGATELDHPEIAALVATHIDNLWWAQTVTIGYERLRGLRAPRQQRDGTHNASKSMTIRASRALW